ncbi:uncharacterized protein TRIREDRAFT_121396, partial [Trichoderma reesei QM6a]
ANLSVIYTYLAYQTIFSPDSSTPKDSTYTHTHTHTQWPDEPSTSTPSTTPPPAATPATPAPSSPSSRASCARPRRGSRAAGPASRRLQLRSRPFRILSHPKRPSYEAP